MIRTLASIQHFKDKCRIRHICYVDDHIILAKAKSGQRSAVEIERKYRLPTKSETEMHIAEP